MRGQVVCVGKLYEKVVCEEVVWVSCVCVWVCSVCVCVLGVCVCG